MAAAILSKVDESIENGTFFQPMTKQDYAMMIGEGCDKNLALVIKHEKGYGWNEFSHKIKIEHFLQQLKEDPKIHKKYGTTGWADLCGYSNGRAFSDGMYAEIGLNLKIFFRGL